MNKSLENNSTLFLERFNAKKTNKNIFSKLKRVLSLVFLVQVIC